MGTRGIGLQDVHQGVPPSRRRLLAPLRYLDIDAPEKALYDLVIPGSVGLCAWAIYLFIEPKPHIFGDVGVLRFARDMLIMAVPFMVGALAAVAMGAPGPQMDRRPVGAELYLDGQSLTLRQFVCYLLGYLCFLGIVTLAFASGAELFRETVLEWTRGSYVIRGMVKASGVLVLSLLISALSVTVFWSLYFLTDVVNRPAR